jgi:hypothetical protein
MQHSVAGIMLITASALAGCAQLPPASQGRGAGATEGGELAAEMAALDPPPRWRPTDELLTAPADGEALTADQQQFADALFRDVGQRCAERGRATGGNGFLREVIADLYAQDVGPALSAEALMLGGCGETAAIVRELVAQGGQQVVEPVVERAILLNGPASRNVVERAAGEGLAYHRSGRESLAASGAGPLAGANLGYSMIYFPINRAGDGGLDAAPGGAVTPRYGIYTYILFGEPSGAELLPVQRDSELLRVIETYATSADGGARAADLQTHTFLVPVQAGRSGRPLEEQTRPALAGPLRRQLASYLRAAGDEALAARLNEAPGPFLVSALEPGLVPADPDSPRLLVDLSEVGPEYIYSVVDAYDRRIQPDAAGTAESLAAIRERLLDVFPSRTIDAAAAPAPAAGWIYLFDGRRAAWSSARPMLLAGAGLAPDSGHRIHSLNRTAARASAVMPQ